MKRSGVERVTLSVQDLIALGLVHADERLAWATIKWSEEGNGLILEVEKVSAEVPV